MGKRIKKIKNMRLHREGTNTLLYAGSDSKSEPAFFCLCEMSSTT